MTLYRHTRPFGQTSEQQVRRTEPLEVRTGYPGDAGVFRADLARDDREGGEEPQRDVYHRGAPITEGKLMRGD